MELLAERSRSVVLLASLVLAGVADAAHANVDFEDQPLGPVPPTTILSFDGPLFMFSISSVEITEGSVCGATCPDNGSRYLRTPTSGIIGSLTIEGSLDGAACAPNCNPFDLLEVDVAEPTSTAGSVQLTFTGFVDGGGSDTVVFHTDGVNDGSGPAADFETIVLPGTFRNLNVVTVLSDTPGIGFAVDNLITRRSVPVLATWGRWVLAAGLLSSYWWIRVARRAG